MLQNNKLSGEISQKFISSSCQWYESYNCLNTTYVNLLKWTSDRYWIFWISLAKIGMFGIIFRSGQILCRKSTNQILLNNFSLRFTSTNSHSLNEVRNFFSKIIKSNQNFAYVIYGWYLGDPLIEDWRDHGQVRQVGSASCGMIKLLKITKYIWLWMGLTRAVLVYLMKGTLNFWISWTNHSSELGSYKP